MRKIIFSFIALLSIVFASVAQEQSTGSDKIYDIDKVDTKPEYPGGGDKAFNKHIMKNLRIPDVDTKGTFVIILSYVVEKDGSMSSIKIVKDPGHGLGEQGLKVLQSVTQKWLPATIKDKPVRVAVKCPISVSIKD